MIWLDGIPNQLIQRSMGNWMGYILIASPARGKDDERPWMEILRGFQGQKWGTSEVSNWWITGMVSWRHDTWICFSTIKAYNFHLPTVGDCWNTLKCHPYRYSTQLTSILWDILHICKSFSNKYQLSKQHITCINNKSTTYSRLLSNTMYPLICSRDAILHPRAPRLHSVAPLAPGAAVRVKRVKLRGGRLGLGTAIWRFPESWGFPRS